MLDEVRNFREDLYYRLNVFPVNTLHLSERRSDIPSIVANMLYKMDLDYDEKTKICSEALVQLEKYNWPGNKRTSDIIQGAGNTLLEW